MAPGEFLAGVAALCCCSSKVMNRRALLLALTVGIWISTRTIRPAVWRYGSPVGRIRTEKPGGPGRKTQHVRGCCCCCCCSLAHICQRVRFVPLPLRFALLLAAAALRWPGFTLVCAPHFCLFCCTAVCVKKNDFLFLF